MSETLFFLIGKILDLLKSVAVCTAHERTPGIIEQEAWLAPQSLKIISGNDDNNNNYERRSRIINQKNKHERK